MNSIVAALVNGIVVGAGVAITIGLLLQVAPRSWLNAATRHAIWWVVLAVTVALPACYFRLDQVSPSKSRISEAPTASCCRSLQPRFVRTGVSGYRPTERVVHLPPPVFPIAISPGPWPGRIVDLWLGCALLMLSRLIASALILECRKKRASPIPSACWMRAFSASNRHIRIACTRESSVPVVSGPWRATILFPARLLDELSEAELEQIGTHEAAHLARYDDYKLLIQRMVQALFVLNPVVHWISRRIDLEREIACDDFVIAATGDPGPYAACLARVVELSGGVRARSIMAAAAVESRSHLAKRVDMLFDARRNAETGLLGARLAFAMCSIAAMGWGGAQMPGLVSFRTLAPMARPQVQVVERVQDVPRPTVLAQVVRPAVVAGPATQPAPMVMVPVQVRDPQGRFVTGLDSSVFTVKENGVEQTVTQLATSEDRADLFVLVGWEVKPDEALQPFLKERIDIPAAGDLVQVHGMGQLSTTESPLNSIRVIERRLGHLSQRQAAVIVTDSSATFPRSSLADIENAVGSIGMPVFIFDLAGEGSPSDFLRGLASGTGGRYYYGLKDQRDIADLLPQVAIALRNMYVLGYTPANAAGDGNRQIEVSIHQPRGLPPLTVSYRADTAH